jgi:HPr kinase/phosphorylase
MNKLTKTNIHATCVSINNAGILLLGKSGSGKSDLALRLIMNKGAKLVADDRVDIFEQNGKIFASAPKNIKGLLEVRGVGIVNMPAADSVEVKLAVELAANLNEVERMPKNLQYQILNHVVPLLKLYPFEASAADKVVIKLNAVVAF